MLPRSTPPDKELQMPIEARRLEVLTCVYVYACRVARFPDFTDSLHRPVLAQPAQRVLAQPRPMGVQTFSNFLLQAKELRLASPRIREVGFRL